MSYRFNPKITYKQNGGQYQEVLKAEDIYRQDIFVSRKDFFKTRFPNIFVEYSLGGGGFKQTDIVWKNWKNNPLNLWQTQLNFATWCASSACGVSSEHLSNANEKLILSLYRFHLYYHIRRVLKRLDIALPFERNFNKNDNSYNHEEFLKICDEYQADGSQMKYRGQYYASSYQKGQLKYFTNDSMMRWIIENSQGITKPGLYMISESVRAYVFLLLNSQASARSNIVGTNANNLTAQRAFLNAFEDIVNHPIDIRGDIQRYQDTLKNASSKVDYNVGEKIYMMPSNMNLNLNGRLGYDNKILISKSSFNPGINQVNRVVIVQPKQDQILKNEPEKKRAIQKLPHHERIQAENHQDEKTAVTVLCIGASMLLFYFFM